MSATTQVTDFSDLYTSLLNSVRSETGVTATTNIAKRYINTALHDMHLGFEEKFPWAERHALLITNATYSDGTVSANAGDTAIVGSGTLFGTSRSLGNGTAPQQAAAKIVVGGDDKIYELSSTQFGVDNSVQITSKFVGPRRGGAITAFASGSNTTVSAAAHGLANTQTVEITGTTSYNGAHEVSNVTTDTFDITTAFVADDATGTWFTYAVSGATYQYFEDEYDLAADFLRPFDQQRFANGGMEIPLIGRNEFRRRYPLNKNPATPKVATIFDRAFTTNTTPVRRIAFYPPPDDLYVIPYSYITSYLAVTSAGAEQTQLSSDDDEPIVPLRYRHAIVFHALYHWYRDRSDDVRSQEAKAEYNDIMLRVLNDTEIGESKPRIEPRMGSYRRQATTPYRSIGNRRYDIHGKFDRLEW